MKKQFFAFFFLFHFFSQAQISFEKGYFISNNNEKTDCFIKNIDWKSNPTEFEFKLSLEESNAKTATLSTVKEFGINDYSKYKRYTVQIEKSSDDMGNISKSKTPVWLNETLFLKILIEGDATLFSYNSGNLFKYFFETKNSPIEQLVRIKYVNTETVDGRTYSDGSYKEFNQFRQQLFNVLKCDAITEKEIENTKYEKSSLLNLFTKYNSCGQSAAINYVEKNNKNPFTIKITAGLDQANLRITDPSSYRNLSVDIKNKIVYKFGAELEYSLPFNKDTWSLFLHPTFFKFELEKDYTNEGGLYYPDYIDHHVVVNHTSLEIPFGLRYYLFLNKNSKIYFNGAYTFNFIGGTSSFNFNDGEKLLNSGSRNNFLFGIGYNYKSKYSAELRTNFDRQLLSNYTTWSAKYSSIGIILGYRIF